MKLDVLTSLVGMLQIALRPSGQGQRIWLELSRWNGSRFTRHQHVLALASGASLASAPRGIHPVLGLDPASLSPTLTTGVKNENASAVTSAASPAIPSGKPSGATCTRCTLGLLGCTPAGAADGAAAF